MTQEPKWMEEFEKLWPELWTCQDLLGVGTCSRQVKAFISKLAQSEYERGYKDCEANQENDSWARNSQEKEQDIVDGYERGVKESLEALELAFKGECTLTYSGRCKYWYSSDAPVAGFPQDILEICTEALRSLLK